MSLPLDDVYECFTLNFPDCMGKITKCPNLMDCHNEYSGNKMVKNILRTVESDKPLSITLVLLAFIPLIYIIITFMVLLK